MRHRNLDFEIEVTPEQWQQLGRRADALGPDEGYDWDEAHPDDIRLYLTDERAPNRWRDQVAREGKYGASAREVARLRYNGGRPFAAVEPWTEPQPPQVLEQEQQAASGELESWVRHQWQRLARDAGLHYERGHIPQD